MSGEDNVKDLSDQKIRNWLREKPRTEDELVEMFTKCIEAGYEGAIEHHQLYLKKKMIEVIMEPPSMTGFYDPNKPWWKFW